MSDERKPVWPWIAALLIGLPVLYVASFGPACWVTSRLNFGARSISVIYRPIIRAAFGDPGTDEIPSETLNRAFQWYGDLGARPDWGWWCRVYDGPTGELLHAPWEWASAPNGGAGGGISGATIGVGAPGAGVPIPEPHALEDTFGPDPPAPAIAPADDDFDASERVE
jgi:hypothetical protein